MTDNKPTAYRPANWAIALLLGYGLTIGTILIMVSERRSLDWLGLVFSVGVATAVGAPIIAHLKTKIGPEGIGGYNVWSLPRFAHWSEICAAQAINIGGLRYVRVFTEDGARPIWLPLFHQNQDGFEASIVSLAPVGNVLRKLIETRNREQMNDRSGKRA